MKNIINYINESEDNFSYNVDTSISNADKLKEKLRNFCVNKDIELKSVEGKISEEDYIGVSLNFTLKNSKNIKVKIYDDADIVVEGTALNKKYTSKNFNITINDFSGGNFTTYELLVLGLHVYLFDNPIKPWYMK